MRKENNTAMLSLLKSKSHFKIEHSLDIKSILLKQ